MIIKKFETKKEVGIAIKGRKQVATAASQPVRNGYHPPASIGHR